LSNRTSFRRSGVVALLAMAAALTAIFAAPAAQAAQPKHQVKVMSRNIYLGADISAGIGATSLQDLADRAGDIAHQVDDNDFSTRAKGLAAEIRKKSPDLVGLQEGAWWRRSTCALVLNPVATEDYSEENNNFVDQLLAEINKGKPHYRVAMVQPEFDFETPVNYDGDTETGTDLGGGLVQGCDFNARLTMQDAILVKKGVKVSNPQGAHYDTLLQVSVGGIPVNVTRGWNSVDAKVEGAPKVHFVDTHFEAFDNQPSNHTNQNTDVGNGEIREAQADELAGVGGPLESDLPTILLGDLNSDVETAIKPGDELANQLLLDAGLRERSTRTPFACCLNADVLTVGGGGAVEDFDHNVDHVMTADPNKVKLLDSSVTGRQPVNGFWDSDHAGLFSKLRVR
jgi:endonuclease/exonuclease/phosphatase family metal-dependent hydrolase